MNIVGGIFQNNPPLFSSNGSPATLNFLNLLDDVKYDGVEFQMQFLRISTKFSSPLKKFKFKIGNYSGQTAEPVSTDPPSFTVIPSVVYSIETPATRQINFGTLMGGTPE